MLAHSTSPPLMEPMRLSQPETIAPAAILRPSGFRALLIDGRAAAEAVTREVGLAVRALGLQPGLAVVLVGADPASQVYVRAKGRMAAACGFHSVQHDLAAVTTQGELLALLRGLNDDPAIHGILVQMPLPAHLDSSAIIAAISPDKDVDGFHPLNVGYLAGGSPERALVPCTPAGALRLIEAAAQALGRKLAGLEAVVVGRSGIVGKPMAQLLLQRDCTVTIAHSRTLDLPAVVARGDIVVAAVGRAEMLQGAWIKPGAIVIDVGINRIAGENGKHKLVGDVAFAAAVQRAGAITPVPGGAGPMTIALLMQNTLLAAQRAQIHGA